MILLYGISGNCKAYIMSLTHHSWSWALLEKLPIVQPLKNFPAFYGTRRFITVFTTALHWSLSWARSIQSIPSHPISLRSLVTTAWRVLRLQMEETPSRYGG
jgi:hypothetical protein